MIGIIKEKLDDDEVTLLHDIREKGTQCPNPVVALAIHLAEIVEEQAQHPSRLQTHTTASISSSSSSERSHSTAVPVTPRRPSSVTLPPSLLSHEEPWQTFLAEAIDSYVLPDIQRLTDEVRPDDTGPKPGLRGCTIPLAMMLFAVIDLFGFLTRSEARAKKDETKCNFRYLLSESRYFPKVYKDNFELLLKIYRHGVMHQIFPKASAIAKAGRERPIIAWQGNTCVLNVDRLSTDVVVAIQQIRQDLDENRDPHLATRMNDRLRQLEKDDAGAVSRI